LFTAQEIFNLACDLIGKRSANGTIDGGKTAIYRARAPGILTLWQGIMSRSDNTFSVFEFDSKPIPNLLAKGFEIQEHIDIDIPFEADGSVKAYHIEPDAPGTIYVEDYANGIWNILATITVPNTVTSYTKYKALVTPTAGATKSRFRLSGATYYKVTNMALYSYPLLADRIPDFRPWVKHTMPTDFKSLDQIIKESSTGYTKDPSYKWEGKGDLYVAHDYVGKIRIIYKPIPVAITALTQTIPFDDVTCVSGSYFLASHLIVEENPASADFFQQVYEELRDGNKVIQPSPESEIVDIYGINMNVGG